VVRAAPSPMRGSDRLAEDRHHGTETGDRHRPAELDCRVRAAGVVEEAVPRRRPTDHDGHNQHGDENCAAIPPGRLRSTVPSGIPARRKRYQPQPSSLPSACGRGAYGTRRHPRPHCDGFQRTAAQRRPRPRHGRLSGRRSDDQHHQRIRDDGHRAHDPQGETLSPPRPLQSASL